MSFEYYSFAYFAEILQHTPSGAFFFNPYYDEVNLKITDLTIKNMIEELLDHYYLPFF